MATGLDLGEFLTVVADDAAELVQVGDERLNASSESRLAALSCGSDMTDQSASALGKPGSFPPHLTRASSSLLGAVPEASMWRLSAARLLLLGALTQFCARVHKAACLLAQVAEATAADVDIDYGCLVASPSRRRCGEKHLAKVAE